MVVCHMRRPQYIPKILESLLPLTLGTCHTHNDFQVSCTSCKHAEVTLSAQHTRTTCKKHQLNLMNRLEASPNCLSHRRWMNRGLRQQTLFATGCLEGDPCAYQPHEFASCTGSSTRTGHIHLALHIHLDCHAAHDCAPLPYGWPRRQVCRCRSLGTCVSIHAGLGTG